MSSVLDFRKGAWRPGPLLPPNTGRDAALTFVIAVLCFMATIAAIGALAADRAASGWQAELAGSASVLIRPSGGESPDAAAIRGAEALAGADGVEQAFMLEREQAEALLQPWLGTEVLADLPIPRMIAVELDPEAPASADALRTALAEAGVDGEVDDHSQWTEQISRAGGVARLAALGLAALLSLAAAAAIMMGTRAALERCHTAVEVLHYAGGEDRFVAGLFTRRFMMLAFRGGLIGAGGAAAVLAAMIAAGGPGGLIPIAPLAWSDLYIAAAVPLIALVVGAITAHTSAHALLKQYP